MLVQFLEKNYIKFFDLNFPLSTIFIINRYKTFLYSPFSANCQLPPDKFPPKEDPKVKQQPMSTDSKQKSKKVVLNSSENLFAEIRDMNFSAVGPVLSREAKRITAEYEVKYKRVMFLLLFLCLEIRLRLCYVTKTI